TEETPTFSEFEDDLLTMMLMCCHPSIPEESRIALTLKTVGGFSVEEIARAFLSQKATIAQRLVRAKKLIREESIPMEMPSRDARARHAPSRRIGHRRCDVDLSHRGRHRGVSRCSAVVRGNGLAGHHLAVRRAARDAAVAGRGAQSCDCHRDGRWTRRRNRGHRIDRVARFSPRLPFALRHTRRIVVAKRRYDPRGRAVRARARVAVDDAGETLPAAKIGELQVGYYSRAMPGPIGDFVRHHFRHFNAAAMVA